MKRNKLIVDAFHSYQPTGATAPYGEGYAFHADNTAILNYPGFTITGMRSIPGVKNDVYVDYSYLSGSTTVTGVASIYVYPTTTTTTTTVAPTTTTTTTL